MVRSQIDILIPDPSLTITCIFSTQMDDATPFKTPKSYELSNGIKKLSIESTLTLPIVL
jgi:hypothetical protein